MKQVILFIVGVSFGASIYAQSQIITGTNVAGNGKPLIFTPVIKEEPVNVIPEKVIEAKPQKAVNPAKLQRPYPSLESINVFTTLSTKPYYGITPLDGIDTFSLIPRDYSEKIKTNLHGQLFATGTLLPKKGQETILAPMLQTDNTVAENGIELNGPPVISNPALTNPANYVPDNSNPVAGNNPGPGINVNGSLSSNLSNYSTPNPNIPVYSGTNPGVSTYSNPNYYLSNYSVPGAENTNGNPGAPGAGVVPATGQQTLSPIDFADTAAMAPDPMRTYGLPSSKLNLKSQDIKKGTFTAAKGAPKIFIPIPKDSIILEPSNAVTGKQNVSIDTTPYQAPASGNNAVRTSSTPVTTTTNPGKSNPVDYNKDNTKNSDNYDHNAVTASAPAYLQNPSPVPVSTTYLRTTFYVSQEGKYSVAFTSTQFYVTISNEGKLADYGILSNGAVTNDYNRKVSMVGNVKVVRNFKGDLDSISDVHLSYTYDGKINKIGNLQILYNRDGLMQKVGDINVEYNYNNTVDKIANYRIGYKRRQVIGIDDSDGLVVYKPSIQN